MSKRAASTEALPQLDGHYDYVIIGAGPAGLQLAYYLQRAGCNYIVLERAERAGSFFEQFPRHRTLLSINKVHTGRVEPEFNMRHDWNSLLTEAGDEPLLFKEYSKEYFPNADALVRYLGDYSRRFELNVRYGFDVERIEKSEQNGFIIHSAAGVQVTGRCLTMATGVSKPYIPDIPGIEHAEGYEAMSVDAADFAGKSVLILGKGNSAFETANHLMAYATVIHMSSPEAFKFAWNSHFVGHLRSINTAFIDSYLLKSQNAILDGETRSIERLANGKLRVRWAARNTEIEEEIEQVEYDHILRCTGFRFDADAFDSNIRPTLTSNGRLPLLRGSWESVNVPGLFFAGTLTQSLDYKKAQSGFIHGFRHNIHALAQILRARYEDVALPFETLELTAQNLASRILQRANMCSTLWQQVGFLTDVITLPSEPSREGAVGEWYKGFSHQFVSEHWGSSADLEYYTLMMTYGPCAEEETVFQHVHGHNPTGDLVYGDMTIEIHPMIRHFKGSTLLAEYHVRSDFMTDWSSNFFLTPLVEFFRHDLQRKSPPKIVRPKRRELIRDSAMRFSDVIIDGQSVDRVSQ